MYGPSAWGVPNSMMEKDHIYNWDASQNVSFPAQVTATKFNGNLDWSKVQNKPSTYPPAAHDHNLSVMINAQLSTGSATPQDSDYYISQYAGGGTTTTTYQRRPVSALWTYIKGKADAVYASKSHNHTKSQITDFPASLKNPTTLTIQTNGTTAAAYDGSSAKTVNITKASIGLENVDNTADTNKSVKYATSAGNASTATKATTADNAIMAAASKCVQLFTSTRPTSMNFNLGSADYNKKITYSIATSSTKEGKPPQDSLVTTYAWDDDGWGAQLAISSDSNPRMYVRGSGNNEGNSVWDANWKTIAYSDDAMTPKPHTHDYAGSLSAGGSANSAVKLDTSAGSITQPVYFKNGKPTVIGYTISSSVPANAKFTDTTYDVASSTTDGLMSSDDKKKLNDFSGVVSITKSIQLTTDWQDVGISGKDLETGTYVIQVSGFDASYTSLYSEIYSGIMTWYASETNDLNNDEIFLHNAGHASNSNDIYLRTSRRLNGNGDLHLQIACKVAATGTDTLTFKFRRLI